MNDFKVLGGFGDWLTDVWMDIGGCRVAFATKKDQRFCYNASAPPRLICHLIAIKEIWNKNKGLPTFIIFVFIITDHTCHSADRISAPFLNHLRWHTRFELISFWSEVSWSLFKQDSNQSILIYSLTLVQTTCMVALLFQISEIM